MTSKTIQAEAIARILNERAQQDVRWGVQEHHDLYWLAIAMEELGEAARKIIESARSETNLAVDCELVQCAAVLVAWVECRERRRLERGERTWYKSGGVNGEKDANP